MSGNTRTYALKLCMINSKERSCKVARDNLSFASLYSFGGLGVK